MGMASFRLPRWPDPPVPRSRKSPCSIVRAVALASALGIMIVSATASAGLAHERRHEPPHHRHALKGIDVSHYQGAIDWPAVARDHVAFAYIKATEGVGGQDARFARNWRGAARAGIRVGAYHYFIFCRSARAQAYNFLAATPRAVPARCRPLSTSRRRAAVASLAPRCGARWTPTWPWSRRTTVSTPSST